MCKRERYHGMSWEAWYQLAEKYVKEHGNLLVPRGYIDEGYRLGRWIERQRAAYNGKVFYTALDEERIRRLNEIGMVWKLEVREDWNTWYAYAKEYYRKRGNLKVSGRYVTADGHCLGNWIREQRKRFRDGQLSKQQIRWLNQIGMVWRVTKTHDWDQWYEIAQDYYRENGNLRVPTVYVTADGMRLGQWICVQRERRKGRAGTQLNEEEIRRLDEIGMIWDIKSEWNDAWEDQFAQIEQFVEENQRMPHGAAEVGRNGKPMAAWVSAQKALMARGRLREERCERLQQLMKKANYR